MPPAQDQGNTARSVKWEVIRTLLINALAPYLIYMLLKGQVSDFAALVCSAIPPLLESIWSLVKRRRMDVMAVLVLGGIVLSLLMMLVGGNARLLLVRESLITGLIGLLFLGSLLLPRPLIFYLAREMNGGDRPENSGLWEKRWQHANWFRRGMRLMTLIWGLGTVLEAVVRIWMAETLPIQDFLVVSPFVQYGIIGGMILWNVWYVRRMKQARTPPSNVS